MTLLGSNAFFGFNAKDCLRVAKNSGKPYKVIGITDYQCYGSLNMSQLIPSEGCSGERGYNNTVGLYKVLKLGRPELESLGCWASGRRRVLPIFLKWSFVEMNAERCLDIVIKENVKEKANGREPYTYFGIRVNALHIPHSEPNLNFEILNWSLEARVWSFLHHHQKIPWLSISYGKLEFLPRNLGSGGFLVRNFPSVQALDSRRP